ncbi:hypothetical protein MMC30_004203 [Trapelia coarctata]|nr:hypothetical protein [Trapelia coarctata]
MTTPTPTPTDGIISVLSRVASFLRQAEDVAGQINFHPSLHSAVGQLVKSSGPIPEGEIADVVQALDDGTQDDDIPSLCSRLGTKAFVLIFAVLRVSERCLSQETGLCLLIEALEEKGTSEPNTQTSASVLDNAPLLSRKTRIGADILRLALKAFCNSVTDNRVRRWMGLLTVALVKDCKENANLLATESEERRHELGSMVIEEQDELLRYIAGSVIRHLVCEGVPTILFWATDIESMINGAFFESEAHNSQWLELFEDHLDEIDTQTGAHAHKIALFSQILKLGRKVYRADSRSVLVTLHGILSIVLPERISKSGRLEAAKYVDIPLDNIIEVDIREPGVERPSISVNGHVRSFVDIHLIERDGCAFFVNARAQRLLFVGLAFDAAVAEDFKRLISTQKSHIPMRKNIHRSPLNVSQADLVRSSQNQAVSGAHHSILDVAQDSPGEVPHRVPKGSIHHSILHAPDDDPNEAAPDDEEMLPDTTQIPDADRLIGTAARVFKLLSQGLSGNQMDLHNPRQASALNSRPCGNHHQPIRVSDAGSPFKMDLVDVEAAPGFVFGPAPPQGQETAETGKAVIADSQTSQHGGDLLDESYTSTAQWRDGVTTIEHAQEFAEIVYDSYKLNKAVQEAVEQSLSPEVVEAETPKLRDGAHAVPHPDIDDLATGVVAQTSDGLGILPAPVKTSEGYRKPLAVKVSQRLLGRQGRRVSPAKAKGDESPAANPQDSTKSVHRTTKNPPAKQSPPKIKTTYKSREKKEVPRSLGKDGSVAPAGETNVFDIPSSPTRTAKQAPKSKQTKTAPTEAKLAAKKNSTQAKGKTTQVKGKSKQPSTGSERKTAAPKDVSAPPIQDDRDNNDDSTGQDGAKKNEAQEKAKPSKRKSGSTERPEVSTVTKKGKSSKGAASSVSKQLPGESTVGKQKSKPTMKRKSVPAALNHPERRRAAAINANQKIQGLSAKADQGSQDNDETLGSPKSEGVNHDDQSGQADQVEEAAQDGQGFDDIGEAASGAPERAVPGARKPVDLADDHNKGVVSKDHVSEQELQQQEAPQVPQADQTNMPVDLDGDINIGEAVTNVPETAEVTKDAQMVAPAAEMVQVAPRSPPNKIETTTAPAVGFLSPGESVDLVEVGGRLDMSGGNVNRHARDTRIGDTVSGAGARLPQTVPQAAPTFSKTPRVSPETNVHNTRSREEAIGVPVRGQSHAAETPGTARKHTTHLHPNLDRRSVAPVSSPNAQKIPPICPATRSIPQRLRSTPVVGDPVPEVVTMLSTVNEEGSEDAPQVIHISSGEDPSSESESVSPPKKSSKTVPAESRLNKKRKSEDKIEDSFKRIKLSTSGPAQKTEPLEEMDAIATDDYIQRKSVIIGFNTRGPRNQGLYSGKRPRAFVIPQDPEVQVSRNTPSLSVKRKHPDDQESTTQYSAPRRVTTTPAEKRRRTVNVVPPTRSEYARSLAQTSSPNLESQSHKMNSQGSRVLDNGSPMATVDQVRRINGVSMDHLLRHLSNKEGDSIMAENLDIEEEEESHSLWEPNLSLPAHCHVFPQPASVHALKQYERRSSSNVKALPSSPTAPSRMLEDMTVHKIAADGRLVNVHTATVIRPAEPQDPFMDISRNLPNPFLRMLRASTKEDGARGGKGAAKMHLANGVGKDTSAPVFDPDRTLVEVETRRYGRLPSSSHGEPSSSPTSVGKRRSLPSKSDEDEQREELVQLWMEALRPHQRGALASLHEMSNRLVRHLISKESVIDDTVRDYDLGGNKLLNALENAHSESQQSHQTSVANAKQSLTNSYGEIEKRLGQEAKEVKGGRVANMEKKRMQEHHQHQEYLNTVMLAYGGS